MSEEQLLIALNFTNDDETVTGDGLQSFLTTLAIGMLVKKDVLGEPIYYISSVTDDNSFELTGKYQGITETAQAVIQRSYTTNYHLPRPMAGDHGWGDMMSLVVDTLDNAVFSGGGWLTPFTQDDGSYMATDKVKARDSDGLALTDDGDTYGLRVLDGGYVLIGAGSRVGSRILEIRENSNYLSIGHDGSDALFSTDDGTFIFATAEALTNTKLNIKALTGMSSCLLMGETGGNDYRILESDLSDVLDILPEANWTVKFFSEASAGECRAVQIYGYRTGDSLKFLQMSVGQNAADQASFEGLASYYFEGHLYVSIIGGEETFVVSHNGSTKDLVVNHTTGFLGLGGVTDPTYPLEILNEGAVAQLGLRDSDGATGNFATFKQATATLTIDARTTAGNAANLILGTEGAVGIFIDESQYVGVKNSNPLVELDVTGDVAVSGDLAVGGELFGNTLLISKSTSPYDIDFLITDGKIRISSSVSGGAVKRADILIQHYDIDEPDIGLIYGLSSSTENILQFGKYSITDPLQRVLFYLGSDPKVIGANLIKEITYEHEIDYYPTFFDLTSLSGTDFRSSGRGFIGTSRDAGISAGTPVCVYSDGYIRYANAGSSYAIPCVGIAKNTVGAYSPIKVITYGPIYNSGWSFTPGERVYLKNQAGGALTQTRPTSCAVQVVGIAINATTLFVNMNFDFEDLFS